MGQKQCDRCGAWGEEEYGCMVGNNWFGSECYRKIISERARGKKTRYRPKNRKTRKKGFGNHDPEWIRIFGDKY